jgi:hypothetical protein
VAEAINSEPNQPRERRSGGLEEQLRRVLRKKTVVGFDSFIVSQDGFDELEGSTSKRSIVLLSWQSNADMSRCVPGNLFMKRRLSLGLRPPTQIP